MHPREQDRQRRDAQARVAAAAAKMAAQVGINADRVAALSNFYDRDPETNRIRQMEATASLLEEVAAGIAQKAEKQAESAAVAHDAPKGKQAR